MTYRYYIGIDCGVKTGYAFWDKGEKAFICIASVKIHTAIMFIQGLAKDYPGGVFVRVEDARKRKWIPRQKNEKAERGRREGAGSVKRDAMIWEDFLTDLGVDFEMVAPKNNKTKMRADVFKRLTGWRAITNEHGRDAAMLVFGL